jgi:hypothetical protein
VELFEEIRREYESGVGTIKGIARKLSASRMVREAIASAIPRSRKKSEHRGGRLAPYQVVIDRILEDDHKAPRKQRHTAHRIFDRLRAESPGFDVSERSGTQVREQAENRARIAVTGDVRAAELCVGSGSASRLASNMG